MTNRDIANRFRELALLMELQDENPYKIRSYQNAYRTLRSQPKPIVDMSDEELSDLKGIGSAILGKINELKTTGTMEALENYREMTPVGIREMLMIKGIGPKKIRAIWKELGIETTGELLYACNENRLLHLKGFGEKTQQKIAEALKFYNYAKGRFLYADLESPALECLDALRQNELVERAEWTGDLRRRELILDRIHCIVLTAENRISDQLEFLSVDSEGEEFIEGVFHEQYPVRIELVRSSKYFDDRWIQATGSEEFLRRTNINTGTSSSESERERFERALGFYVPPELREEVAPFHKCSDDTYNLIRKEDIRGVVHAHTTDSDGLHSLEQMVEGARSRGYEYLTITDHSKSAFYAGGLSEEELLNQGARIDHLNERLEDFRVFKGIESDILYDGSLDYSNEILDSLEVVIVSIHSQLTMDKDKATARLIRAIEHPKTNILGHPTGRLLLSRPGYPIEHEQVIDACAENGVSIEINANPRRLDLDWKWIHRACEKGVLLSINPDAHSQEGIDHIHFGVLAARKGGLTKEECLNTRNSSEFARLIGMKNEH